jgi:hypothetical protein
MAEDNARINIKVDRNEKIAFKRAIAEAGIDSLQDGYLLLMRKGLEKLNEEVKKRGRK